MLSRRDFLKLGSAVSGTLAVSRMAPQLELRPEALNTPHVVILVCDAMSAENLSLYGYRRQTTPNLERFASRATVYNAHYAAGTFTTPGTASLLTGLYPWTHRAIDGAGLIARDLAADNLFRALGGTYHRIAFSQNMWPNYFFGQFKHDIDEVLSPAAFSVAEAVVGDKFPADLADSHRAFDDFLFRVDTPPASLVLGLASRFLLRRAVARASSDDYPRGLPHSENAPIYFRLADVFDGLMQTLGKLNRPSLVYLHLWSPHSPYRPTKDFDRLFADGWRPKAKPDHVLGDHIVRSDLNSHRQNYDEYVANVDWEFGRLLDFLDSRGILDRSYVMLTSDHGEMFERGVEGHVTPLLYDPVVRVPLIISSPGQRSRTDIAAPTSATDLVPTLAQLVGANVPAWGEGSVLPGLGGKQDPGRHVYMMDAKENRAFARIRRGSFAVRTPEYKLIYYRGYSQYGGDDHFELYDIKNDPEELNDIYDGQASVGKALQEELLAQIEAADKKLGL